MKHSLLILTLTLLTVTLLPPPAASEGSNSIGSTQRLLRSTTVYADVLNTGERIAWEGGGDLYVYDPDTDAFLATLDDGDDYTTTKTGTFRLAFSSDQSGDWDIDVQTSGGASRPGRIWSTNWRVTAGSFTASTDASFYSPFESTLGTKVVEAKFEGLAGYVYSIFATDIGIESNDPTWKSAPKSGNSVTPNLNLYINPPESVTVSPIIPVVFDTELQYVSAKCNDRVLKCVAATQEIVIPRVVFTTASTGRYSVICDVNGDGGFDFISDSDVRIDGVSVIGQNQVVWDGRDANGDLVSPGNYTCKVFVYVAQLHFPLDDVETVYPGLRMFSLTSSNTRLGLYMFWDDDDLSFTPVQMPNGQNSLNTPPDTLLGLFSGDYSDSFQPNVNSRAWGRFQSNSKGNNAYVNTFSLVERNESLPFILEIKDGAAVNCPTNTTLDLYLLDPLYIAEGDFAPNPVFTIYYSFNVPLKAPLDVTLSSVDVSATNGVDYILPATTISFPQNDVCGTIEITIVADTTNEPDEVFQLNFAFDAPTFDVLWANASSFDITIVNDDPLPTAGWTVSSQSVAEGLSGFVNVQFTFALSWGMNTDVTLNYHTDPGSAHPGSDFIDVPSGVATILAGDTSVDVVVQVVSDNIKEDVPPEELFFLIATSASGLVIDNHNASVVIVDDDPVDPGITATLLTSSLVSESGGTASVSVVLDAPPLAPVSVPIYVSDASEASVSPTWIVFGTGNWSDPHTLTLTGLDDAIVDGDIPFTLDVGSAATASTDPSYAGSSAPALPPFTNVDDDVPGIIISALSPAAATTTESGAGSTATFTLVLQSEPTDDVTVSFTSSKPLQATVTASVTLTPANYFTPAIVTISGVPEQIADADTPYTISISAGSSVSDTVYNGLAPSRSSFSLTALNDDVASIQVSPISSTTTYEVSPGPAATFSLVLTSEPSANVELTLTSSNTDEGTLSASRSLSPLEFTPGNWNTPVTVTVTALDDLFVDGDVTYTVNLGTATSPDLSYNSLDPDVTSFSITNVDNDIAGLTLTTLTPSSNVLEDGTTSVSFDGVLISSPAVGETVTFTLASSDASEGSVAPLSLTFNSGNWNVPQTATITAANDDVDDGDVAFDVTISNAVSGDTAYSGLAPPVSSFSLTNVDDDTARLVLSPAVGQTDESGATTTLAVQLGTQPLADVIVTAVSLGTDEGTVTSGPLTFTSGDWNSPQSITVQGVEDAFIDGPQSFVVQASVQSSSDPVYASSALVPPVTRSVINLDNEPSNPSSLVTPITNDLFESVPGDTATFEVSLIQSPAVSTFVSISMVSDDTTEGIVSPDFVSFDSTNYSTPVTVTVTVVDDAFDDGDVSFTILLSNASSTDPAYDNMASDDVPVTTIDDDVASLSISSPTPISAQVTEAGSTVTFDVSLTARPTGSVTIPITSGIPGQASVAPASIVRDGSNWNVPVTVTVTGQPDDIDDGDIPVTITVGPTTGPGTFAGLSGSVVVTAMDDDAADVVVSLPTPSSSLNELLAPTASTFTIVLSSEPVADVTIPISVSDTTEASVSPSSIVFTSGNWNSPVTVTVTSQDDDVDDGDVTYSVNLGPASSPAPGGDPKYHGRSVAGGGISMVTLDDDSVGFDVAPLVLSVTESGPSSATFTVKLTSEPTANVELTASSSDPTQGLVTTTMPLVFTSATWDAPQTVTVLGVNDDVDDGDVVFSIDFAPAVASDGPPGPRAYDGRTPPAVGVTNVDDDTAAVLVSPISNPVTEASGPTQNATISIVLGSQPTGPVTLTGIVSSDVTEGVVTSASSLAFTAGDWDVPQTISVLGVDDEIDDGDHVFVIAFGDVVSTDPKYDVISIPGVSAINVNNDTAAIHVSGREPFLTTSESGLTDVLYVVLGSEPSSGSMFVTITSSDSGEAGVTPSALTFTSASWDVPQVVTVSGRNDLLPDGDAPYSVIISPGVSTGSDYSGLAPVNGSWPAVNAGADSAGFVVVGPDRPTSEGPTSTTFTISLATAPIADVSVPLVSSDVSEGVITSPLGGFVNFTVLTWNIPQTVTVMGVVDTLDDGTVDYEIQFGPCISDSLDYRDFVYAHPMQNLDRLPSINVTILDGVTTEGGGLARFAIQLVTAPPQDVLVGVSSSDPGEGIPLGVVGGILFESDTWETPAVVTFQGVPDGVLDGDTGYFAQLTILDGSVEWLAYNPDPIPLLNTDQSLVTVDSVTPAIAPALGGVAHTVFGTGFAPGARVGLGVAYVAPSDVVFVSSTELTIVSPPQNVSTLPFLADLNVTNLDGGFGVLVEAVEFTNDCPFEGMFGSGANCVPCPSCGYCPGGGQRICALPGCWNRGIDSPGAWPCDPPERCLGGGREAPCLPVCATGYDGEFCASCASGYYALGDSCAPCESGAESFPFAVVITYFAFLSLLAVISFFGSSRSVHLVGFFLLMLQWLMAVGTMAPSRTPDMLKLVYLQFGVASFSVELLKPGCLVEESSFPLVYYSTVALFAGMACLVFLGVSISSLWQVRKRGRAWKDDVGPEFWKRLGRSLTILLSVGYFALTSMSLRVVHCVETPLGEYMQSDASVRCYDSTHMTMHSVAVIVLVFFTLGFLVLAFWRQYRHQKRQDLANALAEVEAAQFNNMLVDDAVDETGAVARKFLDEEKWWFAAVWLLSMLILAVASTILTEYPIYQLIACCLAFLGMVLISLRGTPFLARWRNKSSAVFAGFCSLCAGFNFAASDEVNVSDGTLTTLSYVILVLLFLIIVLFTVLVVRSVRRNLYYQMQDAGEEGVLADEHRGDDVDLGALFSLGEDTPVKDGGKPTTPAKSGTPVLSRGVKVSPSPIVGGGGGGGGGAVAVAAVRGGSGSGVRNGELAAERNKARGRDIDGSLFADAFGRSESRDVASRDVASRDVAGHARTSSSTHGHAGSRSGKRRRVVTASGGGGGVGGGGSTAGGGRMSHGGGVSHGRAMSHSVAAVGGSGLGGAVGSTSSVGMGAKGSKGLGGLGGRVVSSSAVPRYSQMGRRSSIDVVPGHLHAQKTPRSASTLSHRSSESGPGGGRSRSRSRARSRTGQVKSLRPGSNSTTVFRSRHVRPSSSSGLSSDDDGEGEGGSESSDDSIDADLLTRSALKGRRSSVV